MKGKPPRRQKSGAQKRARSRELKLEHLRTLADEIDYIVIPKGTTLPDSGDGAEEFSKLGPPPLDEPETALEWVRRAQLIATQVAITKPLTDALRERLKWAKDLSAVIGMTFSRSSQEAKVKELETQLRTVRRQYGTAKIISGTNVKKSPNARGTRRPRVVPPTPEEPKQ